MKCSGAVGDLFTGGDKRGDARFGEAKMRASGKCAAAPLFTNEDTERPHVSNPSKRLKHGELPTAICPRTGNGAVNPTTSPLLS
jgi:hypothetical protein